MAFRPRQGSISRTRTKDPSIRIEVRVSPDINNPIENIGRMRGQLLANIYESTMVSAEDRARALIRDNYTKFWTRQPSSEHTAARGYAGPHADVNLAENGVEAFLDRGGDVVGIALFHPESTKQQKNGKRAVYYGNLLEGRGTNGGNDPTSTGQGLLNWVLKRLADDVQQALSGSLYENFTPTADKPARRP